MTPFIQLLEKVFWTYVQSLLILVIATDRVTFTTQLAIAALPAALTVIANGLPANLGKVPLALDVVYRVVRSAAVAFIGFLLAAPVFDVTITSAKAAGWAALMAALVTLKSVVASHVGDSETAATLPASVDHALAA
jgi:hypothetical protein